jgi:hypothetical protein
MTGPERSAVIEQAVTELRTDVGLVMVSRRDGSRYPVPADVVASLVDQAEVRAHAADGGVR